jgi:hypothetical protein
MTEIGSIHQPLNREVLVYLMTISAVYNLMAKRNPPLEPEFLTNLDLGDLRTHPELGGFLRVLPQEIPGAFHGYILGYDVLVSSRGVIFAIATGMAYLAFRTNLPNPKWFPWDEKATKIEALSHEWQGCSAFGEPGPITQFKEIAERALANVEMLSDRERLPGASL